MFKLFFSYTLLFFQLEQAFQNARPRSARSQLFILFTFYSNVEFF